MKWSYCLHSTLHSTAFLKPFFWASFIRIISCMFGQVGSSVRFTPQCIFKCTYIEEQLIVEQTRRLLCCALKLSSQLTMAECVYIYMHFYICFDMRKATSWAQCIVQSVQIKVSPSLASDRAFWACVNWLNPEMSLLVKHRIRTRGRVHIAISDQHFVSLYDCSL